MQADHLSPGARDQPGQHGEILSLEKNTKINRAWWHAPVVPATRKAMGWEDRLSPGSRDCRELRSCHGTLAWPTERPCLQKEKEKKKRKKDGITNKVRVKKEYWFKEEESVNLDLLQ